MKTYGRTTFENKFNLKNEIIYLLNNNNILYKKITHNIESNYQKNRFKPQFVGQEVWVKNINNQNIVITQELYDECKFSNNFELITLMF